MLVDGSNNAFRKVGFILLWGVLGWGGFMALSMTLVEWHRRGHLPPSRNLAGALVIWPIAGFFFGLTVWTSLVKMSTRPKAIRTEAVVKSAPFFTLILALLCALVFLYFHP